MRSLIVLAALVAMFAIPSPSYAQRGGDGAPDGPPRDGGGDRGRGGFDGGRGGGDGDRGRFDFGAAFSDPAQREEMFKRIEERVGPERAAEFRARIEAEEVRRFDSDGDGAVTNEERQAGVQRFQQEQEQRRVEWQQRQEIRQWDTDGDGKLSDEEKAKAEAAKKEAAEKLKATVTAVTKKYDTDANGELSPDEVSAMREAVTKMLTDVRDVETVIRAKREAGDRSLESVEQAIRSARFGGDGRGPGGPGGRGGPTPPASGGEQPAPGGATPKKPLVDG